MQLVNRFYSQHSIFLNQATVVYEDHFYEYFVNNIFILANYHRNLNNNLNMKWALDAYVHFITSLQLILASINAVVSDLQLFTFYFFFTT